MIQQQENFLEQIPKEDSAQRSHGRPLERSSCLKQDILYCFMVFMSEMTHYPEPSEDQNPQHMRVYDAYAYTNIPYITAAELLLQTHAHLILLGCFGKIIIKS